jgi:hypothetical protein
MMEITLSGSHPGVTNSNSFGIFDGVMAAVDKLDAPDEGQEIIYQKYFRGQVLAREVASHRYDIFKRNDTFNCLRT